MDDDSNGIRYNKDMWTLITGSFVSSAEDAVSYELDKAERQLHLGVNVFHRSDANKAADDKLKSSETPDMLNFLGRLVVLLDVDMSVAYDLLTYYVQYEFRGSTDGMRDMISVEDHKDMLFQDIWLFYRSERMFLLKCINFLWTYFYDSEHVFHELYTNVLKRHSEEDTFQALLQQMMSVMDEKMPTVATHGRCMTGRFQAAWFISNMREQIQTIHNMIIYLEFHECSAKEFQQLYLICKSHSFGSGCDPPPTMHPEFEYFREIIGQMESILLLMALNLQTMLSEGCKLYSDRVVFHGMLAHIESIGTQQAHGPLIIAWMALVAHPGQTVLDPPPDFFEKNGSRVFKLKVFPYLTKLLKSTTFQDASKLKKIAFDCVEKLLCLLLECFAMDSLLPMPGLFELVATLLSNRTVTDHVWDGDRTSGLWLIINEAQMIFTYQFLPFTNMVESVASCGVQNISSLMFDLESLRTDGKVDIVSQLDQTVDSIDNIQLSTPPRVSFLFSNASNFRCHSDLKSRTRLDCYNNFFTILIAKLAGLLTEISRGSSYVTESSYADALGGVRCLHQLVENQCKITKQVSKAIAIVFNLIEKYSFGTQGSGEFLAACLDVACSMLMTRPEMVCRRLSALKFLPAVDITQCTSPTVIARGEFFHMHAVGFVVANDECLSGKYPLLLAYLRFVRRVMQPNEGDTFSKTLENNVEIILPCMVFVLTTIFPNHDTWPYERPDSDRANIAHHCLHLLHLILSPESASQLPVVLETLKEQPRPREHVRRIAPYLLHQTALFSLLQTDTSVALVKVVAVGDRFLQELMERQPDWLEGNGVLFTNNVILAMSILNRVLLYKSSFCTNTEFSKIELVLLREPPSHIRSPIIRPASTKRPSITTAITTTTTTTATTTTAGTTTTDTANSGTGTGKKYKTITKSQPERVVHIIANYIFHSFNPKLPVMAVRLLKRFSTEFSSSLLSSLGPDSRQICQHFLFRLNSLRESSDLKVAILELMTAAIAGQPGLSEAFLNLDNTSETDYSSLDYISNVLDQLQTAPETVTVTIHRNVISLVHALWTLYCQRVLDYIRCRETFWDGLCAPFFLLPVSKEIPLYFKIIVIITLEMKWFGPKMAASLASNLEVFFKCEEPHFARWSEFVGTTFVGKNDTGISISDIEELAISWQNFLTVLVNYCPFTLSEVQKKMITAATMKILLTELETGDNQIVIKHMADAMLVLITTWKKDCFEDFTTETTNLQKLLELLCSSYKKLKSDSKESLFAFVLRYTTLLSEQISADDLLAACVMQRAALLASTELVLITHSPPALGTDPKEYSCLPATLTICLVEKMVSLIGSTSYWHVSLKETKLVLQLMDAAQLSLETPTLFRLATVSLDALLLLSYTDFAKTIVMFRVGSKLWMPMIPPVEVMANGLPWFMGKWSQIYERSLRLITRLLAVHELNFVAEAISFVGIHEPYLIGIMMGIRYCVKPDLLRLAVIALDFLQTLQQFGVWKEEHPNSFYNINRCVISTLDRCIAYLLQPNILRAAFECPKPFDRIPFRPTPLWAIHAPKDADICDFQSSPAIAQVMNRLLECINACLSVLYPLSPSYLSVMTDILDTEVPISPLVENTYRTPTVEQDPQGRLTFGAIQAVISLCIRAIGQKGVETFSGVSPVKGGTQMNDKYLSSLSVPQLKYGLEMSLSFMLAQTLVAATNTCLPQAERKKIIVTFVSEMALHVDNIKRVVLGEEIERQLTPSPEKPLGGGGALKRLSSGGRTQCARRLQFVTATPPKQAVIDADPGTPVKPLDAPQKKSLTLQVAPRYQPRVLTHTSRQYIQMMMNLYQSCFQSANR